MLAGMPDSHPVSPHHVREPVGGRGSGVGDKAPIARYQLLAASPGAPLQVWVKAVPSPLSMFQALNTLRYTALAHGCFIANHQVNWLVAMFLHS